MTRSIPGWMLNVTAGAYWGHLAPPRPPPPASSCLAPLTSIWPPVHPDAPPPILVFAVLIVTFPLANLPSIRLLARLNTIGVLCRGSHSAGLATGSAPPVSTDRLAPSAPQVLCFMIILGFAYASAAVAGVDPAAFKQDQMVRPASAGIIPPGLASSDLAWPLLTWPGLS